MTDALVSSICSVAVPLFCLWGCLFVTATIGQSVQVYRDGVLINTREYNAGELFRILFLSLSRARSLVSARSSARSLPFWLPCEGVPRTPSRTLPSLLFASTSSHVSLLPALSAGKDWSELEAPGRQSAFDADLIADEARKHVAHVTEHAKVWIS